MRARFCAHVAGVMTMAGLPMLGTMAIAPPAYPAVGALQTAPAGVMAPAPQAPGDGKPKNPQPKNPQPKNPQPEDPKVEDPKDPKDKKPPKPPPDTEPPSAPSLQPANLEADGVIELTVTAEAKAKILVKEGDKLVAEARATGTAQEITWTARTGNHAYQVTATDKKGNESAPSYLSLQVDATAPKATKFVVKPGTANDTRSTMQATIEPGAEFRLLVDDEVVREGKTDGTRMRELLDLGNGRHDVTLELRDEIGNLRTVSRPLKVQIPELSVTAELLTGPTDAVQRIQVRSTPNAKGFLRITGEPRQGIRLSDGTAELKLTLIDGIYEDPSITIVDTQGRRGTAELADITVDTTAPSLVVTEVSEALEQGRLSVEVSADEGSVVSWRLLDQTGQDVLSGKYVAPGGAQTIDRDVAEGSYDLEVTATDTYGRATVEELSADVAADPRSSFGIVAAAVAAVVLLLGVLIGIVVLRRRRHAGEPKPERARRRSRTRKGRRADAVTEGQELAAYQEAERIWLERRDALTTLLAVAHNDFPPAGESEEPEEKVLYSVGARLIEMRNVDGDDFPLEVDEGQLTVTNKRLAFDGVERRDWWYPTLERVRHVDHDRTMLKVADEKQLSGLGYGDPEVTRLYIDLALAEHTGTRDSIVTTLTQGLRDHEMRRPAPPFAGLEPESGPETLTDTEAIPLIELALVEHGEHPPPEGAVGEAEHSSDEAISA